MAVKTFIMMSAAVAAAAVAAASPGHAGGALNGSCVRAGNSVACSGRWGGPGPGFPYVVNVPDAAGDRAEAETAARERRWQARCRPVVKQDRYGVGRYSYAAAGCEFGRSED